MTPSSTPSSPETEASDAAISRSPVARCFYVISCVLATLQLLRAYFFVDAPYLNAARYESGTERLPYQARLFMALVMDAAKRSSLAARIAGKMNGPLHSPDTFSVFVMGLLSLGLIALVTWALYRRSMPSGRLAWLPYPLVLGIMAEIYIVRFQQAVYFPYDLLAASLFTLCVYLVYSRRYLLLIPVFLLACFTRETIILIVPLLLLNIESLPRISRQNWKELVLAGVLSLTWFAIYRHLNHLYLHNDASETYLRVHENLMTLRNPMQWSQVASAGGFLLLVPFFFWKNMPDLRLRRYALLIPAWLLIIFVIGKISESRVYGELTGFLAVYCTVLFENIYVKRRR